MKFGDKEFEFNSDVAIDISSVVANIGVDWCVKKVVKELIKHSLPEPTGIKQKIIFKIGEYAFTVAIGSVVADKISKAGMFVKMIKETYIKTKNELKEKEDGLTESETQQQQVQEG